MCIEHWKGNTAMKKLCTKILCVLVALSALCMTACGEPKPTAEYLEFYGMLDDATYEVRNTPDGYELQDFRVGRGVKEIEFVFDFDSWTFYVMLAKNPTKPISVWYRHPSYATDAVERIAALSYVSSTELNKVEYVLIASQYVDSTHEEYNAIVQVAKLAYEDWLPVVNDVILQISGGKYSSLDDFRKIAE